MARRGCSLRRDSRIRAPRCRASRLDRTSAARAFRPPRLTSRPAARAGAGFPGSSASGVSAVAAARSASRRATVAARRSTSAAPPSRQLRRPKRRRRGRREGRRHPSVRRSPPLRRSLRSHSPAPAPPSVPALDFAPPAPLAPPVPVDSPSTRRARRRSRSTTRNHWPSERGRARAPPEPRSGDSSRLPPPPRAAIPGHGDAAHSAIRAATVLAAPFDSANGRC